MASSRPRPPRWIVIAVGIAIVVVAYLLGSGLGGPAAIPETTPSASPGTPSPARPSSSPSSGASDSAAGSPSASPVPSGAPQPALTGAAMLTDPTGDVTGAGDEPEPDGPSAADLETATLTGDGRTLTIELALAGDIPPDGESILWAVELWQGDERAYSASVQQVGTRLFSAVYDWSQDTQENLATDAAELDGRSLTLRVPAALLAGLEGDVRWWASTERDGGYEDRLPDGGAPARVPFPG